MGEGNFTTKDGIVKLQPFGETQKFAFGNEKNFDSLGCPALNLISAFNSHYWRMWFFQSIKSKDSTGTVMFIVYVFLLN